MNTPLCNISKDLYYVVAPIIMYDTFKDTSVPQISFVISFFSPFPFIFFR